MNYIIYFGYPYRDVYLSCMKRGAFFLLIILSGCNQKQQIIEPTQKPLMEAVYASGFVVAEQEYQSFSQADGTVSEILVKEGELVKTGQPVLRIESTVQSARYAIALENYEQARKNAAPILSELEATYASSKTKKQFDSLHFERFKNLLKANATSRVEYDRAELQFKNSRNEFIALQNRITKTKNELALAIRTAENQLKIASEESGNFTIKSEINGMVFKIMKEKGELVRRTEALAILGNPDKFYLKLSIDELDIQRVKSGQQVMVKIDAYPQKIFRGNIVKVYPLIDTRQQSLRVDAVLSDTLPSIFSGLAVEANIVIRENENALVIPKTALLEGDSVWIDGDKPTKIKVARGIETIDEVEITHGITKSSRIIIKQ